MSGPSLARSHKLSVQHYTLEVYNLFNKATKFTPAFRWLLVMELESQVYRSCFTDRVAIFTARKRSLWRLCFYTCLSVILFTRGCACSEGGSGRGVPAQGGLVLGEWRPPVTTTAAGGTHPTGMHSCSFIHLWGRKQKNLKIKGSHIKSAISLVLIMS